MAIRIFGPGCIVLEKNEPPAGARRPTRWFVLTVPGYESLRIGATKAEALAALSLGAAAGIHALRDGMRLRERG